MGKSKTGDWICVDSMSKIWELSQDLGYKQVAGIGKQDYLAERRAGKTNAKSPIPSPDQFWNLVKDAHDANFMDPMIQDTRRNILWITGLSKVPRIRENAERKEWRLTRGIDMDAMGAPRLPYQPHTVLMYEWVYSINAKMSRVAVRVLKDRGGAQGVTFELNDEYDFPLAFFEYCRPQEEK
jgi:hypothetical protein